MNDTPFRPGDEVWVRVLCERCDNTVFVERGTIDPMAEDDLHDGNLVRSVTLYKPPCRHQTRGRLSALLDLEAVSAIDLLGELGDLM